jgi:hypothetical protein
MFYGEEISAMLPCRICTKSGGGVSNKHLDSYLNEIRYRFNRRFWERELFDRLIQASLSSETIAYAELVGRAPTMNNC